MPSILAVTKAKKIIRGVLVAHLAISIRLSNCESAWAGCFGTSTIGLPAIGEIPNTRRCFAILGYGGNGITFSVIAAQLIQRAILGLSDPDADLFALPT